MVNPKKRIMTALKNKQPDRVPVTLGLSEMVPVRKSGLSYIDYFWNENRDLVKDRCDVEKGYGADVFLHSAESPSPDDPEISVKAAVETREEVVYEETIHTRHGDLTCVKRITPAESVAILEPFVKNPEEDMACVLETLKHPGTKDFSKYLSDWEYAGESGHCGFWLSTPIDWWAILRRSPEAAIYDLIDFSGLMESVFEEYTSYCVAMISKLLEAHGGKVDSLGLGGSSTSMSVISPSLLEKYSAPFVRALKAAASAYGTPLQYHMCGKSREGIPILVEAGVDGMDALESPPTGNVDLGEIKRLFGERISLRGNVNSIAVMLHGGPREVERDVKRCMEDAKSGGGFILGVGDQTPYSTPDENIHALVESGRKYGMY